MANPRISLDEYAKGHAVNATEMRTVLNKIVARILTSTEDWELQNVGVFTRRVQNQTFRQRSFDVFRFPSRIVMRSKPPARRRSQKLTLRGGNAFLVFEYVSNNVSWRWRISWQAGIVCEWDSRIGGIPPNVTANMSIQSVGWYTPSTPRLYTKFTQGGTTYTQLCWLNHGQQRWHDRLAAPGEPETQGVMWLREGQLYDPEGDVDVVISPIAPVPDTVPDQLQPEEKAAFALLRWMPRNRAAGNTNTGPFFPEDLRP